MKRILTLFLSIFLALQIIPVEAFKVAADDKRRLVATDTGYTVECIDLKSYGIEATSLNINTIVSSLNSSRDVFPGILGTINVQACLAFLATFNDGEPDINSYKTALTSFGVSSSSTLYSQSDNVFSILYLLQQYQVEEYQHRENIAFVYSIAATAFSSGMSEAIAVLPQYELDNFYDGVSLFDSLFATKLIEYMTEDLSLLSYIRYYKSTYTNLWDIDSFEKLICFFEDPYGYYLLGEGEYGNTCYYEDHKEIFNTKLPSPFNSYYYGDLVSIYISAKNLCSRVVCDNYVFNFIDGEIYSYIKADYLFEAIETMKRTSFITPSSNIESRFIDFLDSYYVEDKNISYVMCNTGNYSVYKGGIWLDDVLRFYFDSMASASLAYVYDSALGDYETYYYLNPYQYYISYGEMHEFILNYNTLVSKYGSPSISGIIGSISNFDELEEAIGVDMSHIEQRIKAINSSFNFNTWLASFAKYVSVLAYNVSNFNYEGVISIFGTMGLLERYISSIYYDEDYTFNIVDLKCYVYQNGYSPEALASAAKDMGTYDFYNYFSNTLGVCAKGALLDLLDQDDLINFAIHTYHDVDRLKALLPGVEELMGIELMPDSLSDDEQNAYIAALIKEADKKMLSVNINGVDIDLVNGQVLDKRIYDTENRYTVNELVSCVNDMTPADLLNYFNNTLTGVKKELLDSLDDSTKAALAVSVCETTEYVTQLSTILSNGTNQLIPSSIEEDELDDYVENLVSSARQYLSLIEYKDVYADLVNGEVLNNVEGKNYTFITNDGSTYAALSKLKVAPDPNDNYNYRDIEENIEDYEITEPITLMDWFSYLQYMTDDDVDDSGCSDGVNKLFNALYNTSLKDAGLGDYEDTVPKLLVSLMWAYNVDSVERSGQSTSDITEETVAALIMPNYNSSVFYAYGVYLLYQNSNYAYNPVLPYLATNSDLRPTELFGVMMIHFDSWSEEHISDYQETFDDYNLNMEDIIYYFNDNTSVLENYFFQEIGSMSSNVGNNYSAGYFVAYYFSNNVNKILPFYVLTDDDYLFKDMQSVLLGDCYVDLINLIVYPSSSSSQDVEIPREISGTDFEVDYVDQNIGKDNSNIKSLTLPSTLKALGNYAFSGLNLESLDFYRETEFATGALDSTSVLSVNAHGLKTGGVVENAPSLLIPEDGTGQITISNSDSDLSFFAPKGAMWELEIEDDEGTTFSVDDLFDYSTYEITIPSQITLENGTVDIDLSSVGLNLSSIASGVKISADSSNDWYLVLEGQDSEKIAYSIDTYSQSDGSVYEFETEGDETKTITVSISDDIKYAGKYKDSITFEISLN